jgi:alpha-L-fucosidase 2
MTQFLRSVLVYTGAVLLTGSVFGQSVDPSLALWYDTPAKTWVQALPVGNGRLGAMVFGGASSERIQFNEETVWAGYPHEYHNPGASRYLNEIRSLLLAGGQKEAERLAQIHFMSVPLRQQAYQSFGDLEFLFPGIDSLDVSEYMRSLNLDEGVVTTQLRSRGTLFTREVFASHPDQVLVVHLTADRPGSITFELTPTSLHPLAQVVRQGSNGLSLNGSVENGAIEFEARIVVQTGGGSISTGETSIFVSGADEATVILAGATNYIRYDNVTGDPYSRNDRSITSALAIPFTELRERHVTDHQALFRRVDIDLGRSGPVGEIPTDERVLRFREGTDPELAALLFQYGRYLLIASSRPGTQPATLQGLWNDSNAPPWESKWTVNINTEMNYWLAESTNLAELHEPLFDMLDEVAETGRLTAHEHYDARGWVLHHNTDIWRGTAPTNS